MPWPSNSCTAALHLALEAIGLKAGETAVVPTMTFAATTLINSGLAGWDERIGLALD